MKEQRPHDQGTASRYQTDLLTSSPLSSRNLLITKLPRAMRSRKDAQRTIPYSALIEVESDCEHLLQNCGRWLDVYNAPLATPRTVARHLTPLPHRDRHVLMPADLPICTFSLVEQDCANREGVAF